MVRLGIMAQFAEAIFVRVQSTYIYALGTGADEAIPKRLACENQGWYAKVNDSDAASSLKHAMMRYF